MGPAGRNRRVAGALEWLEPRGPTKAAWPESRQPVKLGTVTIDKIDAQQLQTDKALLFLPGQLPAGIEIIDPMIGIGNAAYPISFGERQ